VAGEEQARFSNLVLPHLADGFALARWVTGNTADAEDVVQEACLRAYRGINGYAGGNARAWLLAIVRNTCSIYLGLNFNMIERRKAERRKTYKGAQIAWAGGHPLSDALFTTSLAPVRA
jgi:DNA-directed RNA polymerase specialized sigma24 family protein